MIKKFRVLKFMCKGIFLCNIERKILKLLFEKGKSYPGDLIKDLKLSNNTGIRSIINLRSKGYIVNEYQSSFIYINPEISDAIKIIVK